MRAPQSQSRLYDPVQKEYRLVGIRYLAENKIRHIITFSFEAKLIIIKKTQFSTIESISLEVTVSGDVEKGSF